MAIYKNREVAVIAPMHTARPPQTIIVQYKDGTHENVSLGLVRFTEEEKRALVRNYPSEFDAVEIASDDDIKAVRLGATPPSDPDFKLAAEGQARRQKLEEENRKNLENAKKEAEERINKELEQSKSATPVVMPTSPTSAYVESNSDNKAVQKKVQK